MIERVVVTGAQGGIGSACVDAFRDLGAEVIGVDRVEGSSDDLRLDISDPDCGSRVLAHLADRPVDVLVNNAAVGYSNDAVDTDAAQFDRLMAVNLRAPFLLSAALYPSLRQRSGSVVNVSSVHAVATSSHVSVYAASKGGLVALTLPWPWSGHRKSPSIVFCPVRSTPTCSMMAFSGPGPHWSHLRKGRRRRGSPSHQRSHKLLYFLQPIGSRPAPH